MQMHETKLQSIFGNKELKKEFFQNFGVVLIKPDAIELGVEDYIIGRLTQELYETKAGTLQGVYEVCIKRTDIPGIYPSMSKEDYPIIENYLTNGSSVLLAFRGLESSNLQDSINKIKGRRLGDWDIAELEGVNGFGNSIRGILPVPGTIKQFEPVIERIKLKKQDPSIRFSDDEYSIYCKNLIHTPNDYIETWGLLRLLSKKQLNEVLSTYLIKIIS